MDQKSGGDSRHLRVRNEVQHAELFDLVRQLRYCYTKTAPGSSTGRSLGKKRHTHYLFEKARISRSEWADVGKSSVIKGKGQQEYSALSSPEQLLIVAAGGPAGGFGAIIPPWLGNKSQAVTLPIGVCVDCET